VKFIVKECRMCESENLKKISITELRHETNIKLKCRECETIFTVYFDNMLKVGFLDKNNWVKEEEIV